MKREDAIKEIENFVKYMVEGYDSGHDWWHIERVRKLAKYINEREKLADPFIVDLAALLHDSADSKFSENDGEAGYLKAAELLVKSGLSKLVVRITNIMRNVSFSNKKPSGDIKDPVLLIIQDADKLDAMGAIGVARAFNYGGFRNNLIYSPDKELNKTSTIGHFYEKLLLLKSMMNTSTGSELAADRHRFLESFLQQFYMEVNFSG